MTVNTPGYNRRIAIFFTHDKHGRKLAYHYDLRQFRAFRMPLAEAELLVATDAADLLDGHPFKPFKRAVV